LVIGTPRAPGIIILQPIYPPQVILQPIYPPHVILQPIYPPHAFPSHPITPSSRQYQPPATHVNTLRIALRSRG